jgi:hypothetical protein
VKKEKKKKKKKKKKGHHKSHATSSARSIKNLKWHPDRKEQQFMPAVEEIRAQVAAEVAASLKTRRVRVKGRSLTPKELKTHTFSQVRLGLIALYVLEFKACLEKK